MANHGTVRRLFSHEELIDHRDTHDEREVFTWTLLDARGIGCGRVCDRCEETVRAQYRPEIFEDGNYECDEPIETEDY